MKLQPMRNRVIVEKMGTEKISELIEIPDTALRPSMKAMVMAKGSDIEDPDIKEESMVTVAQWSGTEVSAGNEIYWIMTEDQILAVDPPEES